MATINCKTAGGNFASFMSIIHQIKNAFIEKKYRLFDGWLWCQWLPIHLLHGILKDVSAVRTVRIKADLSQYWKRAPSTQSTQLRFLPGLCILPFISSISFLHLLYNHTENMAILLTSKYSFGVKYFMHNLCMNNFQHNEWKNQWLDKYIIYINYERRKLKKKQNGCRN